jgi:hypothetical protein
MFSPLFILKAAKQHSPNPANIQTTKKKKKSKTNQLLKENGKTSCFGHSSHGTKGHTNH